MRTKKGKNIPMGKQKAEVIINPTLKDVGIESRTAAQSSLHPKSRPADEMEVKKLFDVYSQLNQKHRSDFLEYLKDFEKRSHSGLGVPDGDAEKNRKYHKEELSEALSDIGFTEEAQEKVTDMFWEAVRHKTEEEAPFRKQLQDLVSQYSPSPFLNDYSLDTIERLALRVDELEGLCEMVEHQSEVLREEIIAKEQDKILKEEVSRHKRPVRRSLIEETMLEPDESNADCLFNEEERHIDPKMKRYLDFMDRTLGVGR